VLLVDDIVSSGSTLLACAHALKSAGAAAIDAVVVHALFPANRIVQFELAGIRSIRSTDSLSHPSSVIPLAEPLAEALRSEADV
jgi:ribose-phosphate pyrophosphokinase